MRPAQGSLNLRDHSSVQWDAVRVWRGIGRLQGGLPRGSQGRRARGQRRQHIGVPRRYEVVQSVRQRILNVLHAHSHALRMCYVQQAQLTGTLALSVVSHLQESSN